MINFREQRIPVILMLVLFFWGFYQCLNFKIHDFGNYYYAALGWISDLDGSVLYHPGKFNEWIKEMGATQIFASYSPSPPSLSLLFVPFTFLNAWKAKWIWVAFNFIAGFFAISRLQQISKTPIWVWSISTILFVSAFYYEILFGQMYLFLLFLLVEGYYQFKKNKTWLSALCWSTAILLKLFPAIIFAFLLFKGEWKQIWRTTLVCSGLILISILLNGFETWQFYFEKVLSKSGNGFINTPYNENMQSLVVWLNHLFSYDEVYNPHPIAKIQNAIPYIKATLLGILIGAAIHLTRFSKLKDDQIFGLWIFLGILLSPSGSTYSLLLLLPFFFSFIQEKNRLHAAILCFILFIAINLPLTWVTQLDVALKFPRLYLLLLVFGLVVTPCLKPNVWKEIVLISIILIVPNLFNKPSTNAGSYTLPNDHTAVITNYYSKDGYLIFDYITEEGIRSKKTNQKINFINLNPFKVINSQIHLNGEQITFSNDNKWMPQQATDGKIYYLSDYRRGYGFTTIRKHRYP